MRDDEVPNKTAAGRDEIQRRARKLPPVLRSILLMVDGQHSAGQLRHTLAGLHGPADALEQLQAMGLIELAPAAAPAPAQPVPSADAGAYAVLYARMSAAVREHLGLRGYFLQLKIERCTDAAELRALVPELLAALAKANGPALAETVEQGLRTAAPA